jgi:hypothetical protein
LRNPGAADRCHPSDPEPHAREIRGGRQQITGGKRRFESSADVPFDGLVVHATAQTEHGFLVFDVFDSQEAVDRFNDAMRAIPRDVGIQEPPKFYPAHTFIQR